MTDGDAILIAAQSGRALAAAARRARLRPFVLDQFGDEDTLVLAEAHCRLTGRFGSGRRDVASVMSGLDELAALAGGGAIGIVLGSGFEGAWELIDRIAQRYRLIGAGAATIAALKDPNSFAGLCARLRIPHPEVETNSHAWAKTDSWLVKRVGGSGGSHIRLARSGIVPPGHYHQRRVPGRSFALNFLADGRDTCGLAFTRQWSAPSAMRPFRFGGALAPARDEPDCLPDSVREAVSDAVARLVGATGLRGLASADFLVDGGSWWLTEINPRPGATLDVLDRRPTPLLASHIEASLGRTPRLDAVPSDAAGSQVCYAARAHACIPPIEWPDFVCDRPRAGSRVARDAPLCTVTAHGQDSRAVEDILRERSRVVCALLDDWEDEHGNRHQDSERQRSGKPARR